MTTDLDRTEARLVECLHTVATIVPDEAPPWDPAPRLPLADGRARPRVVPVIAAVAAAAALIAVAVGVALTREGSSAPTSGHVRSIVIAAGQGTTGARTARLRITSQKVGYPAVVATGLVDFATPAFTDTVANGASFISIGDRAWMTVWPPVNGTHWVPIPTSSDESWPSPAEAALARELEPDTAPDALISALRADGPSVTDLGVEQVDGVPAQHYRAVQGGDWQADVWVADGRLVRFAVRSLTGTVTIDYSDYGVPVTITPPPLG